jgi:IS4 transposase
MLLTATALLWAWSDELTLGDRFKTARKIILHLFSPQRQLAASYQAFTKLLRRWTEPLISCLQAAFRERMQRELPDCWLILGFVVFGVDGSRGDLPRTRSHEQAYSLLRHNRKSRKGRKLRKRLKRLKRKALSRKVTSPQLWLTTLFHLASGLPWDWQIGPADSSERAHLLAMLSTLPPGALIAADAGFVGYESLKAILDSGRHLLIRVGSNVRLLRKLGYARESGNTVYLWPDREGRRRHRPLVLRLVVADSGKHPVFLVTSVPQKRLTDRQVVELYARRWGIEVFYRSLKQTFQRRKLRSTSAENAHLEMTWSFAGLWAMGLYALSHFQAQRLPPRRLSVAKTLRAFRRIMRDYLHPGERGGKLRERLQAALIDEYHRENKASRDYPRKKQEAPPGPPKILTASPSQIQRAQALRYELPKKG